MSSCDVLHVTVESDMSDMWLCNMGAHKHTEIENTSSELPWTP